MFYLHFILEHWGHPVFKALQKRKSKEKLNHIHSISDKKKMKYHIFSWNLLLHKAWPTVKLALLSIFDVYISLPSVFYFEKF